MTITVQAPRGIRVTATPLDGLRARLVSVAWLRLLGATTARSLLFTIIGMMFWATVPSVMGWIPTTVLSDSMAPLIRAGDVVVSQPVEATALRPGQIVLADDPDHLGRLRLHRFTDVTETGQLVTKGDANYTPDSTTIPASSVRGVGFVRVPFVGLPIVWLHEHRWTLVAASAAGILLLMWVSNTDRTLRRRHALDSPRRKPAADRPGFRTGLSAHTSARSVIPVGLSILLAGCLVLAGGTGAAFNSSASNPTSSLATSTYPCLTRTPAYSPYFYLAYNEASGTSALDSSGNGRAGTLTSGATRTGGSCTTNASPVLTLDGSTGQVTTSSLVSGPNVFTVATWLRTTTTTGGKLIGFGNAQSGPSSAYDRQIYMNNAGKLIFGIYNSGYYTITSSASYNDGKLHHVAATLSSSGMALYVDGARVGTNFSTTRAEPQTGYWRIGYDNTSGWPTAPSSNFFRGDLDDTAVYLSALTAAQISAEYAKGT
jgi:signal peptidase I